MDDSTAIAMIGGIDFFAYTTMAGAYWNTAADWARRVERVRGTAEEPFAKRNRDRAESLFRLCTGTMLLIIVLMVFPAYVPGPAVLITCKSLLLIPTAALLIMCVRYTAKIYAVPIDETPPESQPRGEVAAPTK